MYRPSWLEEYIEGNTVPAAPYAKQSSRSTVYGCFHCGAKNSETVLAQTTTDTLRLRLKCRTCTHEYDVDLRVLGSTLQLTEKTTDIAWGF